MESSHTNNLPAQSRSDDRLRAVFEQTAAGIAQLDLDGRFVMINQCFCDLVGYTRQELLAMRMQDVSHPDDITPNLNLIEKAKAAQGSSYILQKRYIRKDGSYVWVSVSGSILWEDGKPTGVLGVVADITELKATEQALRESEQRWQLAINSATDGIWDWNIATEELYWSPRCKEMLGYQEHELEPMSPDVVRDLLHPDDRARAWEHCQRHCRGETPHYSDEYRLRHKDGSYRWVSARGMAFCDKSGKAVRFTGSHTDITERKRVEQELREAKEQAERASEAKSEFLATLSHELRTPLTPVLLTASLMESNPRLPEEFRADIATIRRNIELESQLISDLLDLTRIERGKLQLDMQDVDLHLIVRSAIDICQREASAQLVIDLKSRNPIVRGDSTRLQQIFWNLINNAQKFTPPEGTITVRSRDAGASRIRIEVIDTGSGIDPAVIPRLFNAFEQGDARTKRQQAGLGLGLAISKKLAEAHGGTIIATSPGRGKGAAFAVELPIVPVSILSQKPKPIPTRATSTRILRVLLVEDHEPTLKVMTKLLRNLGHQVNGATSVASAAAATRQEPFDLIISDLGLPDGSGLDLMREVREQYKGRAIALTGYGMESDITASREAGFAMHLTKPVDIERLHDAIVEIAGSAVD